MENLLLSNACAFSGSIPNSLSFIPSSRMAVLCALPNPAYASSNDCFNRFCAGSLNVSAENDNHTIIELNVTVPSNRTWNLSTTFCQKSEYPDEGIACEVLVYNLGNDNITINITANTGAGMPTGIKNI